MEGVSHESFPPRLPASMVISVVLSVIFTAISNLII
jgi:hypothetical protein